MWNLPVRILHINRSNHDCPWTFGCHLCLPRMWSLGVDHSPPSLLHPVSAARRVIQCPRGMFSVSLEDHLRKARCWESLLVWLGSDHPRTAWHVARGLWRGGWPSWVPGAEGAQDALSFSREESPYLLLLSYVSEGHCTQHVVTILAAQFHGRSIKECPRERRNTWVPAWALGTLPGPRQER